MAVTSHDPGETRASNSGEISSSGVIQLLGLLVAAAIGAFAGLSPGTIQNDSGLSGSLSILTEGRSSGSALGDVSGGSSESTDGRDEAPYQGVALFPADDGGEQTTDDGSASEDAASGAGEAATATVDASDALTPIDDDVPAEQPDETAAPVEPSDPTARGEAALAMISYPWQDRLSGWTISFHPEKSGLYGLTLVSERRIEVYVRDGQSQELLAHVIAHEIGHAVDVSLNDGPERRLWEDARGLDAPWWPGNGTNDFSTGAGDFAESFAAWQVGGDSFRSELGPPPNAEAKDLLAVLSAG